MADPITVPALTPAQKEAQRLAEERRKQQMVPTAQPVPVAPPMPVPGPVPGPVPTPPAFPIAPLAAPPEELYQQSLTGAVTAAERAPVTEAQQFGLSVFDPGKTEHVYRSGPDFAGYEPQVVEEPGFRNITADETRRAYKLGQIKEAEANVAAYWRGRGATVFDESLAGEELNQIKNLPFYSVDPSSHGGAKALSFVSRGISAITEAQIQAHVANNIRQTEETLSIFGWTDKKRTAADDAVLRGRFGYSPDELVPAEESGLIPPGPMETDLPERISSSETYGQTLQRWKDHPSVLLNKGYSPDKLFSEFVRVHEERPWWAQALTGLTGAEQIVPFVGLIPRGWATGKQLMPGLLGSVKFGGKELGETPAGRAIVDAMRSPGGTQALKRAVQQGEIDKQVVIDMFEAASARGYTEWRGYGKGPKARDLDAWLSDTFITNYDESFPMLKIAGGADGVRMPKTGIFADSRFTAYWAAKGLADATEITTDQANQFTREILEVHARPVKVNIDKLNDIRRAISNLGKNKAVTQLIRSRIEGLTTPEYANQFPLNKAEAINAVDGLKAADQEILDNYQDVITQALQQTEKAGTDAANLAKACLLYTSDAADE